MLIFRIANKEDLKAVEDIYTNSFMDYDFYKVMQPDEKKRRTFIHSLQTIEIRTNFERGQLFVGDDDGEVVFAMTVHFPYVNQPRMKDYLFEGGLEALLECGPGKILDWFKMYEECEKPLSSIQDPMFYLEQVAVKEGKQGKGYGGIALNKCLIPLVKLYGGGTICFITNSDSNVRFYTRNGFECFHEGTYTYENSTIGNWCFKKAVAPDPVG